MNIVDLSPRQLRRAAFIKERLERLRLELSRLLNGEDRGRPHHRMSAAGKRKLAAFARKRWAAARKAGQSTLGRPPTNRQQQKSGSKP